MKDNKVILAIIFMVSLVITMFLFVFKFYVYVIFSMGCTIVFFLLFVKALFSNDDKESIYERKLRNILRTYDAVLIQSDELISIDGRNPIILLNIEDLIDAQSEVRKPISWKKDNGSCWFALLDDKEVYIYILRMDNNVRSPMDDAILVVKSRNNGVRDYGSVFRDIEHTTIIKLDDIRSYKVSPIREKDVISGETGNDIGIRDDNILPDVDKDLTLNSIIKNCDTKPPV